MARVEDANADVFQVNVRHPKSQEFHDILGEMAELHDRKQQDYGRASDPFANVRASEDFGMPGWVGTLVRANDKMRRLQTAAAQAVKGQEVQLVNEGVEDSLYDLAVYAVIALILFRESQDHVDRGPDAGFLLDE